MALLVDMGSYLLHTHVRKLVLKTFRNKLRDPRGHNYSFRLEQVQFGSMKGPEYCISRKYDRKIFGNLGNVSLWRIQFDI